MIALEVQSGRARKLSQRICRILLLTGAMVTLWLALSPHPPRIFAWDKFEHGAAFMALTFAFWAAYPTLRLRWVALILSGFGTLIEILQGIPAIHRDSSFFDWCADSVAIFLATGLILLLITVSRIAFNCLVAMKPE